MLVFGNQVGERCELLLLCILHTRHLLLDQLLQRALTAVLELLQKATLTVTKTRLLTLCFQARREEEVSNVKN